MNYQMLLKDLEEVKSALSDDTELAEELLDHVISEVAILAVNNPDDLKPCLLHDIVNCEACKQLRSQSKRQVKTTHS